MRLKRTGMWIKKKTLSGKLRWVVLTVVILFSALAGSFWLYRDSKLFFYRALPVDLDGKEGEELLVVLSNHYFHLRLKVEALAFDGEGRLWSLRLPGSVYLGMVDGRGQTGTGELLYFISGRSNSAEDSRVYITAVDRSKGGVVWERAFEKSNFWEGGGIGIINTGAAFHDGDLLVWTKSNIHLDHVPWNLHRLKFDSGEEVRTDRIWSVGMFGRIHSGTYLIYNNDQSGDGEDLPVARQIRGFGCSCEGRYLIDL